MLLQNMPINPSSNIAQTTLIDGVPFGLNRANDARHGQWARSIT